MDYLLLRWEHPYFSDPLRNILASGDRMEEPNVNGDGQSIVFNGWGFWILLLKAQKSSGIPKILMLFPVGIRVQCSFPMGMKFQGIFLNGDKFSKRKLLQVVNW